MAIAIFAATNQATGKTDLIKAATRGQVSKFLTSQISIQKLDAVQVAAALTDGAALYDATLVSTDSADAAGVVPDPMSLDEPLAQSGDPAPENEQQ